MSAATLNTARPEWMPGQVGTFKRGRLNEGGKLSTVDLLIMVDGFVIEYSVSMKSS
jgi:hypothetical protein